MTDQATVGVRAELGKVLTDEHAGILREGVALKNVKVTERQREQTRLTCRICGQPFVGVAGTQQCRKCHGDYVLVRVAEHQYRSGWQAACDHLCAEVDVDALDEAVAHLRSGSRRRG